MNKERPPQDVEPIRGGGTTKLSVTQKIYNGKIPTKAIMDFEHELHGLSHGQASLTFFIRDGKLRRYTTSREQSVFPEESDRSGVGL